MEDAVPPLFLFCFPIIGPQGELPGADAIKHLLLH